MKFKRWAILPVAALALAGCQAEKKPATKGSAGGEVLAGSASDAMLPIDTVRSQPPLAPRPTASAGSAPTKARSSGSPAGEELAAEVAPAEAAVAEPAAEQ